MKTWRLWLPAIAALLVAYALKHHYSVASPQSLRWVLGPTATLTSALLGEEFIWQTGVGYLSPDLSIVIAKACAGVNFLIVAFVTLALGFGPRFPDLRRRALWTAGALALAYSATLIANTARIALSVLVAHHAARATGLSFQAAHRALVRLVGEMNRGSC